MIRKMTVDDIAQILKIKDDVLPTLFPCTIGEWVQFLIQQAGNNRFLMIGAFNGDELIGYIVCHNSVAPPLSDHISIIYYVGAGKQNAGEMLNTIKAFGLKSGAARVRFVTKKTDAFEKYGFKTSSKLMELEL